MRLFDALYVSGKFILGVMTFALIIIWLFFDQSEEVWQRMMLFISVTILLEVAD